MCELRSGVSSNGRVALSERVLQIGADYIVTRNVKDFAASKIPAVTPAEMVEIIFRT